MQQLVFQQSVLSYRVSGHGPNVLLLFHGFGQDNTAFEKLTSAFASSHTCYSFDLFFHGQSTWSHGDQPLEKETWKQIIQQFLTENKIDRFSVLGFSLGARFALTAAEEFAPKLDHLFLMAPDGITIDSWYRIATSSSLLRSYFRSMIHKPSRFFTLLSLAGRLRLSSATLLRFAESQMNTEEKRSRVYHAWVVFRHLTVNIREVVSLLKQNNIRTVVILAKQDHVITQDKMRPLLQHLPDARLELVNSRHHGLIDASIPLLTKLVSL